jgi:hypothetical protein
MNPKKRGNGKPDLPNEMGVGGDGFCIKIKIKYYKNGSTDTDDTAHECRVRLCLADSSHTRGPTLVRHEKLRELFLTLFG